MSCNGVGFSAIPKSSKQRRAGVERGDCQCSYLLLPHTPTGFFLIVFFREIVRKRRAFEYALRRRQKRKEDYIEYIQYELNVEALRRKRKQLLNIKQRTRHSEYVAFVFFFF